MKLQNITIGCKDGIIIYKGIAMSLNSLNDPMDLKFIY